VSVKPKVIGVVENDPGMLKALERLLTAHGFVVKPYVSAEAFLADAMRNEMTCLVLDIDLGGMSGIELRRQLAASGWTCPGFVERCGLGIRVSGVTAFCPPFRSHLLVRPGSSFHPGLHILMAVVRSGGQGWPAC
jgi:hypothetical protein